MIKGITTFSLVVLSFLFFSFAHAQLMVPQGGTGKTTFGQNQLLYGIGTGRVQSVATTSVSCSGTVSCSGFTVIGPGPITLTGSASTFSWPFTKQADGSQATTTTLGLFNGFNSTASSTISGRFNLNSLTDGLLAVYGGEVKSYATTTAGTGLTYSGGAFNINTSQNISTLSNLTSNGFVKTSGGTGALSVDTATYLSSIGSGTNGQLAYWGGTNNLGSVATGTISSSGGITTTAGRSAVGGALSIACDVASGSIPGCLSAADWTTFNGKLGAMTFAYPFSSFADWGTHNATSSLIGFRAGLYSTASSTIGAGGAGTGLTIFGGATTTGQFLALGSTTLQAFTSQNATSTNLNVSANHITFGSNYVSGTSTLSFNIASSTLVNGASYNRATTTIQLAPWLENRKIVGASCMATSTGGVLFQVGGKTNLTSTLFCDTNPRTYTFTAIEIAAFSDFLNIAVMKASSTADRAYIGVVTQKLSD